MTIGTVPFLNAFPLTWALGEVGFDGDLVFASPAELSSMLLRGELDVGLLPIAEYLRGVGDALVEGICIAADGRIGSVLLICNVPVPRIEKIAIDRGSKSSVALLRIILADRYGIRPLLMPCDPNPEAMLDKADAMLLIGDSALSFQRDSSHIVLDLASEWKDITSLPFVFAAWVLRKDAKQKDLATILTAAKEVGLSRLEEVIPGEAKRRRLDEELARTYLKEQVEYDLTKRHLSAISTFGELCVSHGLIEQNRPLNFVSGT